MQDIFQDLSGLWHANATCVRVESVTNVLKRPFNDMDQLRTSWPYHRANAWRLTMNKFKQGDKFIFCNMGHVFDGLVGEVLCINDTQHYQVRVISPGRSDMGGCQERYMQPMECSNE